MIDWHNNMFSSHEGFCHIKWTLLIIAGKYTHTHTHGKVMQGLENIYYKKLRYEHHKNFEDSILVELLLKESQRIVSSLNNEFETLLISSFPEDFKVERDRTMERGKKNCQESSR